MADVEKVPTTTPPVRIRWAHLFTPRYGTKTPKVGDEPKFQVTPMFPKTQDKTHPVNLYLNGLFTIVKNLIVATWPNPADQPRVPIVGDEYSWIKDADTAIRKDRIPYREKNPEFAGHYVFTCANKEKTGIFDMNGQEIINPAIIYDGCWCRVSLHPWAWDNQNGRGISFQLNGILFYADDTPFKNQVQLGFDDMFGQNAGAPSGAQNPANYGPPAGQGQAPAQAAPPQYGPPGGPASAPNPANPGFGTPAGSPPAQNPANYGPPAQNPPQGQPPGSGGPGGGPDDYPPF